MKAHMGDRLRKVHAYSCNPRIQLQRLGNETNSFRQDPYLPISFNSRGESFYTDERARTDTAIDGGESFVQLSKTPSSLFVQNGIYFLY